MELISDRGRPISLLEEEQRGGHTIEKHVGKSENFLIDRVLNEVYRAGMFTIGLKQAGSFPSLEAADKLVNSTLSANQPIVDKVASGEIKGTTSIEKDFGSITGYEAYRNNDRSQPAMRRTTAVEMWIRHDSASPNGVLVVTAYPKYRSA